MARYYRTIVVIIIPRPRERSVTLKIDGTPQSRNYSSFDRADLALGYLSSLLFSLLCV